MAVGGGGGNKDWSESPAEKKEDPDAGKPLEDRLVSKTWGTRKDAYLELLEKYKVAKPDNTGELFRNQVDQWPKYLADSNPGSHEKALECHNWFLQRVDAQMLTGAVPNQLKVLIEKGYGGTKPVIKTKAKENLILLFEVSETFDLDTFDALEAMLKHKNLKVLTCAFTALTDLWNAFGPAKFKAPTFLPYLKAAAAHTNPAARAAGIEMSKALYRWLGEGTLPTIEKMLKPAQVTDLTKAFEEMKGKPNEFKVLTRTEQAAAKDAALDEAIAEEAAQEAPDVYDMAMEVDILSKYNPDWAAAVQEEKKWAEKKARLEEVIAACDVPKLKSGDYKHLTGLYIALLKDSNVVVQAHAVKALGALGKPLRGAFETTAKETLVILIPKLKDRKLIADIQNTFDSYMHCFDLPACMEPVLASLKDPKLTGAMKKCLVEFVDRFTLITYIDELRAVQDDLCEIIAKMTESADAPCRESAMHALGSLLGRLGGPALSKYIDALIPAKKAKVEEAAKEVKPSKYDKSKKDEEKKAAAAKKAATAPKAPAKTPGKKPALSSAKASEPEQKPNEDEEMINMDFGPPKKTAGPPARLAKKAAPKATGEVEEKKKEETPAEAAPAGPPRGFGQKPVSQQNKPKAAGAGGAKGPTGPPVVEDEDLGAGLSKEEAESVVKQFYGGAVMANFGKQKDEEGNAKDPTWQNKTKGFQEMIEAIAGNSPGDKELEATAKYVKTVMKDWKESNLNMLKEALNVAKAMVENCERIPKRVLGTYAQFLCDKIGDIKLAKTISEIMLGFAECMGAKFVSNQIVKLASKAKAPANLAESCTVLSAMIEDFGAGMLALKAVIEHGTFAAGNSNPKVRTASLKLLSILYKHLGEAIRHFLNDIKDSTMKLLEDEFKKVTPYAKGEFTATRSAKGEAAEEMKANPQANKGGGGLDEALGPREDISKKLKKSIFDLFGDRDFKKRIKAATEIEEVLTEAKMRVKPDGLTPLYDLIQKGLKDGNKAVQKAYIELLGKCCEAVGEPIKNVQKKLLVLMINLLGDKQSLVRNDTLACMGKWAEAIGGGPVITHTANALEKGSPELRELGLGFIISNKADIKDSEHGEMVKPLCECLNDKASKIRSAAEEIIVEVMGFIGSKKFEAVLKDLKPAVAQKVQPIIMKCKANVVPKAGNNPSADVEMKEEPKVQPNKMAAKPTTGAASKAGPARPGTAKPEAKPAAATTLTAKRPGTAVPQKAQANDTGSETLSIKTGNKNQRDYVDSRNKWMHEELKPQQVDKVKTLCELVYGQNLAKDMFGGDFKKHAQLLKQLGEMLQEDPTPIVETADILFKWCYVKTTESQNTTLALSVFNFLLAVIQQMAATGYTLLENCEAFVLIPFLCEKTGTYSQSQIKDKIKETLRLCWEVYDVKKTFALMVKYGLSSQNKKSVAETLDEINKYVNENGTEILNEEFYKTLIKLVDSSDKGVRENSLTVFSADYKNIGDGVWTKIGSKVSEKAKGLFEQRVKALGGSLPGAGSKLGMNSSQPKGGLNASANKIKMNSSIGGGGGPRGLQSERQTEVRRIPATSRPGGLNQFGSSIPKATLERKVTQVEPQEDQEAIEVPKIGMERFKSAAQSNLVSRNTEAPRTVPTFGQPAVDEQKMQDFQNQLDKENLEDHEQEPSQSMMVDDDDDDIRKSIMEMEQSNAQEQFSPEVRAQIDEIKKAIHNLKYGKRFDSLIALNQIIWSVSQYEGGIEYTANDLVNAFTFVLNETFDKSVDDIQLRFVKSFTAIMVKACKCKEIMKHLEEQTIQDFQEQLCKRMLHQGLAEKQEGKLIINNLNYSMVQSLERCNTTYVLSALFKLLKKHKDNKVVSKMPSVFIKCALKLIKVMEEIIDFIDIERILLLIHELLCTTNRTPETNSYDELIIIMIKSAIDKFVQIKGAAVWDCYGLVQKHQQEDKYISRWIQRILPGSQAPTKIQPQQQPESGATQQLNTSALNTSALNTSSRLNTSGTSAAQPVARFGLQRPTQVQAAPQQATVTDNAPVTPEPKNNILRNTMPANGSGFQSDRPASQVNKFALMRKQYQDQRQSSNTPLQPSRVQGAVTDRPSTAQVASGSAAENKDNMRLSFSKFNQGLGQRFQEIKKQNSSISKDNTSTTAPQQQQAEPQRKLGLAATVQPGQFRLGSAIGGGIGGGIGQGSQQATGATAAAGSGGLNSSSGAKLKFSVQAFKGAASGSASKIAFNSGTTGGASNGASASSGNQNQTQIEARKQNLSEWLEKAKNK